MYGGGALLSSCSNGDSKKSTNNKVTVSYPSAASLDAIVAYDGTTNPDVEWKTIEISIGSSNTVTKADLTAKLKAETTNTDLVAALTKIVDEINADEEITEDITIADLSCEFFSENYFDFAADDYINADLSPLATIDKGATVYALAYYDEEGEPELEQTAIWKISDYLTTLNATETSAKISDLGFAEGAECDIVTIGTNVKVNTKGGGISGTIGEDVTGYCQLSNGKAGGLLLTVPAGTEKIVLCAKNVNKALAIYDSGFTTALKEFTEDLSGDYADYEYEYSFTSETVILITSPSATTNFKAIALYAKAVVLDPPSASSFTANSTATGYSITIDATAEDVTGLEYSTDNKETWNDVASETVTLTTYGTVYFRYKATSEAGASKAISVSVEEYVDTSLPQADKPATTNFTVTNIVNGKGSVVLASTTGIQYLNASDAWEDAVAEYTTTEEKTYKFRTAEVEGTSRASEAIEISVGTYTLPVSAVTTWDLTDSSATAYNTIPLRTEKSTNASTALTVTKENYVGYLGKGLWVHSGTSVEYINTSDGTTTTGRGLGYTKYVGDSSTDEEKAAAVNTTVPAIESAEAVTGPFKVTATLNTAKDARSFSFFVASTASALFSGDPVYSATTVAGDISYTYTGTDAVFIGMGTTTTDGTFYTEVKKIVLTASETIADDVFAVEDVSFTNSVGDKITSLTISKDDIGTAGYQLSAIIEPSYASNQSVTYSGSGTNIAISSSGVVTITDTNALAAAKKEVVNVTVTAAGDATKQASLSLTVNAIPTNAQKVAAVIAQIKEAVEGSGDVEAFAYVGTKTYLEELNAVISALTLKYDSSDGVTVTSPSVAATTLTFTVKSESTDVDGDETAEDTYDVTYPTQAIVSTIVAKIKAATTVAWDRTKGVEDNLNAITTAVSALNLPSEDVSVKIEKGTSTASGESADAVIVTVTSTVDTAATLTGNTVAYEAAYILDCTTLTAASETMGDYEESKIDDYFTRGASTIETVNSTMVIKMSGKLQAKKSYVRFTTTKSNATVKVTFFQSSKSPGERYAQYATYSRDESDATKSSMGSVCSIDETKPDKNVDHTATFNLNTAGTYAVGGSDAINIKKIVVIESD